MKEEFERAFKKLFPDWVPGKPYDFSHGELSEADYERYKEIGKVIEDSLNSDEPIQISLKVYNFMGDASSSRREW